MGPGRSSSLHIGGDSSAVAGSRRTGRASDRSARVELRDAPGAPLFSLGVPSIALFLYLFSAKETAEGFLYFSRRTAAPLVISDLPSSHRLWKERYFFVSGRN